MRETIRVLKTPVTLLVLLAVLLGGAWWGYKSVIAPPPEPPKDPCVMQSVNGGKLKSSQVTVNVYNGSSERGLARKVAAEMKKRGFRTSDVDNTERRITKTIIVGAKKSNPEVQLVALQFKGATIEEDDRPDGTVDVLVGRQFGGYQKARKEITVAGGQVCLPSKKAPSASASATKSG